MPKRRRGRLSMTPLIDVIFLLLLFFMLSSTFSRFAEVDLTAGSSSLVAAPSDMRPVFLRLAPDEMMLNGQRATVESLGADLRGLRAADAAPDTVQPVLLSLAQGVTAQRLTDALVALRAVPGTAVTVLGGGT
ncbi:MAG: biopolymer transporter ExbD [Pseudomonadota bacterium]